MPVKNTTQAAPFPMSSCSRSFFPVLAFYIIISRPSCLSSAVSFRPRKEELGSIEDEGLTFGGKDNSYASSCGDKHGCGQVAGEGGREKKREWLSPSCFAQPATPWAT